jgi:hypothetical protein
MTRCLRFDTTCCLPHAMHPRIWFRICNIRLGPQPASFFREGEPSGADNQIFRDPDGSLNRDVRRRELALAPTHRQHRRPQNRPGGRRPGGEDVCGGRRQAQHAEPIGELSHRQPRREPHLFSRRQGGETRTVQSGGHSLDEPRFQGLRHSWTNHPESIGHAASHGCIRMRNHDVEELFELVHVGDEVELVTEPSPEQASLFNDAAPKIIASAAAATTVGGLQ